MTIKTMGMELITLSNLFKRSTKTLSSFQHTENLTGTNSWIIACLSGNSHKDIFPKDLEKLHL